MSSRFGQLFSAVFLVAALAGCDSSNNGLAAASAADAPAAAVPTPAPAGVPDVEPPLTTEGIEVPTPAIAIERTAAAMAMRTPTHTDKELETLLIVWAAADPDEGEAPLTVSFSCDPIKDAGAVTYEWDFGDGSAKVTDLKPTHTYNKPGTYTARVVVRDEKGNKGEDDMLIDVE